MIDASLKQPFARAGAAVENHSSPATFIFEEFTDASSAARDNGTRAGFQVIKSVVAAPAMVGSDAKRSLILKMSHD